MKFVYPLFLLQSIWSALVVGTNDYEQEYLALGAGLWRGTVHLYADSFTSQWMPLPFWIFGATQAFGPSLWTARALTILIGLAALWLACRLASDLGGREVGILTGLLIIGHQWVSGSTLATTHFEGLVMLELTGLVWALLWKRRRIAMLICGLIFLTKPNYWPAIPFALVYAIWQHEAQDWRGKWEPVILTGLALLAPVAFFADPSHWKILAYTPASSLVEGMGWRPWFTVMEPAFWRSDYSDGSVVGALQLFARRFWLWGVLVCAGLLAGGWKKVEHDTLVIGALFVWLLVWQFLIMGPWVKQAVAYMIPMMPLVAGQIAVIVWPKSS